jgi:hypothetical protein
VASKKLGIWVAALAWGIATTASAQQFNLECNTAFLDWLNNPAGTKTITIKLDLDHFQWCIDECQHVNTIQRVTPDTIALSGGQISVTIDRVNGILRIIRDTGYARERSSATGTCEKRDFTGFPVGKF